MLKTADFDFELPEELIAERPTERRDGSRLLVVDRATRSIQHLSIRDITNFVQQEDIWVFNNSRVIPARMLTEDGFEYLLTAKTSECHWTALSNAKKKSNPGSDVVFLPRESSTPKLRAYVLKTLESGERVLRFERDFEPSDYGRLPLPPYILKRRKHLSPGELAVLEKMDEARYQTTYAEKDGSIAAPTAGLHFTEEMMAAIPHAFITLHVGVGTFRPVKGEFIESHDMHAESFWIPGSTAEKMNGAQRRVAVGTTSVRALESLEGLHEHGGKTSIFIYPPYEFQHCDALFTNFHLPKSTLLMLVSSFLGNAPPGVEDFQKPSARESVDWLKEIYREAIKEKYRFFSYGDAMLIL